MSDPRDTDRRKRKRERDQAAALEEQRAKRIAPKDATVPGVVTAAPDRTITRASMQRRAEQ